MFGWIITPSSYHLVEFMKTIHKHVTMFFAQQRNTVSFYLKNRAISRTFVIQSDNLDTLQYKFFLRDLYKRYMRKMQGLTLIKLSKVSNLVLPKQERPILKSYPLN